MSERIDYGRRQPTPKMPVPNVFKPGNIIRGYKSEEVVRLFEQGERLIDFLPLVEDWPAEMEIMLSWERWFIRKKVPFAVCKREGTRGRRRATYTLWKQDVAEPRSEEFLP